MSAAVVDRSPERLTGRLAATVAAAVATAFVYLVLLGWDREVDVDPVTQSSSGPYETWQITGCTVALGLLAAAGGRARRAWLVSAAISITFTAAWSIGAASRGGPDANLWPIGAALLAPGVFAWSLLVSLLVQRASHVRTRSTERR